MGLLASTKNTVGGFINRLLPPFASGHIPVSVEESQYKALYGNFLYEPPYGYPRYIDIGELRRLSASPTVSMAISTIIDEIMAVPWDILGENEKAKAQIKSFFNNPNKNKESWGFVQRAALRDILEVDAGILVKVFNLKGQMKEVLARDGATFTVNPDVYGIIGNRAEIVPPFFTTSLSQMQNSEAFQSFMKNRAAYFQYPWFTGGPVVPFGWREIVYMVRNPRTDSFYGRSPVEILKDVIEMLLYGIDHNLEYFTENQIPKGVLEMLGAPQEDIERFKTEWLARIQKKDAVGRIRSRFHFLPVVNTKTNFVRFQFTNLELELLEQQKWFSKIVWACFGVTPSELGFTEDSNRATEFSQSRVFKKKAVRPILRLLEYHYNTEIIPEFGYDPEDAFFAFTEYDVEEDTIRHNVYARQLTLGLRTINEIREQNLKLQPVPWGDVPFRPVAAIPQTENVDSLPSGFGKPALKSVQNIRQMSNIENKPFAGYRNFDDCVNKNRDKRDPEAYCAVIMRQVEGKKKSPPKSVIGWPKGEDKTSGPQKEIITDIEKGVEYRIGLQEKALNTESPLVLGPFEVPDNPERLQRAIMEFLKIKKEEIIKLLEEATAGDRTVDQIGMKAITSEIIDRVKGTLFPASLRQVAESVMKAAFLKGLENLGEEMGTNFMPDREAMAFVQRHTFGNISDMTDEVANDLRQALERGLMEGRNPRELIREVSEIMDSSEARASTIARTEFNRALNSGRQNAMRQIRLPGKKEWVATMDARTTPDCRRLHGERVGIDEQFSDGDFHATGPPKHPNCRCTMIFVEEE